MPSLEHDVSDDTQRVRVDQVPPAPPVRRPAPSSRPTAQQRSAEARKRKKRRERITIIALCAAAAVLLISIISVVTILFLKEPEDDGKILNNVFAAGVNLGGMTQEQAKQALQEATENTYSKLDMSVQVLDTTILLSPDKTGAQLDVDAVAKAAFDYGRVGSRSEQQKAKNQAQNSSYTISILPYLNLNTGYIQGIVNDLGKQYSTTLSETSYFVTGTRPDLDQEKPDTTTVHEVLTIQVGTAEYGLDTTKLYEQIMDAYNINLFQVTGECSVRAPQELNCEALYAALCRDFVDAQLNPETLEITPEVYGYGFSLNELKTAMSTAQYGQKLTFNLCFVEPNITAEFYSNEMFQDILSTYTTTLPENADWNTNINLAIKLLNGQIIRAGEEFSFNQIIGEPTLRKGYKPVGIYVGKSYKEIVGGGICQVATTLYNCALMADLDILERHTHSYAPDFINVGFDAEVIYGSADLRLRNNTDHPIRIEATIEDNLLVITLVGTDSKDYSIAISYEISKTKAPNTVYHTMSKDNPGGYADGDILVNPIIGYNITVIKTTYDKETGTKLEESIICETVYAKRDQVIVRVKTEVTPPDDTDIPVDPETPADPDMPEDPENPVDPDVSEDPENPVEPGVSEDTQNPEDLDDSVDSDD